MEIASINVGPMGCFHRLNGAVIFVFQGEINLEEDVEEFDGR